MRFLLAAGVGPVAVTMLLGGCTLDYDLFQVGEGGGGSAPTTTSTTGTDAGSSASTTAVGSTGSTSGGGEGGATTTSASVGTGGEGGVGPILPCEGLALSFEPSSIDEALDGSAWEADETGDGRLDTDFDRLVIDVDGNGSDQAETAEIRTREADLFACSVVVELRQFEASGTMDFPATAYLSAVGDWGGEGDEYEGLEVFVSPREACEIGSRLRGDADWDGDAATCELPTPSVFLRLTHTGEELCHEVSEDGITFQTLHCRPTTSAYRVALGATTVENVMFYFGRIN